MQKKKMDGIIVAVIIGIALLLFLYPLFFANKGNEAVISINGKVVDRFLLTEDLTKDYIMDGSENSIVIKNGFVSVSHANCPDKICISQGNISMAGESIVCLPHKFVIEIEGKKQAVIDDMVN